MRTMLASLKIGLTAGCLLSAGCYDPTPPPPRASVPPPGTYTQLSGNYEKPLPAAQGAMQDEPSRPPFDDVPLVSQPAPEEGAFVDAYQHVGRPRITLYVNRSLQGQTVPTNPGGPVAGVEHVQTTDGPVTIDRSSTTIDPWGRPIESSSRKFQASGASEIHDRTEVYLSPGEYDEASARRIDYDAIENVMTDWMAAGGKTTLLSPHLTEAQNTGVRSGDRNVLRELGKDLGVDVLIHVQARPTSQTALGLQVRLIAEAINTQGGESIGRAFVDVPPPLEKTKINDYTRFLARKLMYDMTRTWSNPRPASPLQPDQGTPQSAPSAIPQNSPDQTPPASLQPPSMPPGAPTPMSVPAPLLPSTQPLSPPASTQPVG